MTTGASVTVHVYNDSPSGHVSIELDGQVYEQQWDPSSGIFEGLMPEGMGASEMQDGVIQVDETDRVPAASVQMEVSEQQLRDMINYAESRLGLNNYGLLHGNCVDFVDAVLDAGGVTTSWRHVLEMQGGMPGFSPVEFYYQSLSDQSIPGDGVDRYVRETIELLHQEELYSQEAGDFVGAARIRQITDDLKVARAAYQRNDRLLNSSYSQEEIEEILREKEREQREWEEENPDHGSGGRSGVTIDSDGNKHDDYDGPIDNSKPIILDLDGLGISVTELSQSTIFVDGGDGLEHRTAWAGAGDGVLFFDADGSGDISEQREYVFTEWDPTATSDLEALRSVFDTNGDGKLTSADSTWSQFRVAVTEPDGTLSYHTLDALETAGSADTHTHSEVSLLPTNRMRLISTNLGRVSAKRNERIALNRRTSSFDVFFDSFRY